MTPQDFLSITEVSASSGIPVATLRRYRQENRGPLSYRIAGRVAYPRQAVAEWVAAEMAASERGGTP
jgi:predicted DNA-binding transcriptional regulator AlpA